MYAWFSFGSILLGFAAWGIPVLAMKLHQKGREVKSFSAYSFTLCAIALVLQLFEIKHRVAVQDFSAIMDTIGPITFVSVVLVVVTVILNGIGMALCTIENGKSFKG